MTTMFIGMVSLVRLSPNKLIIFIDKSVGLDQKDYLDHIDKNMEINETADPMFENDFFVEIMEPLLEPEDEQRYVNLMNQEIERIKREDPDIPWKQCTLKYE